MRLDAFITERCSGVSRASVQEMIKNGHVAVAGRVCTKPSYVLKVNEEVLCIFPESLDEEPDENIKPVAIDFPILYEDDDCLVINKSAGIAVHPGHGMEKNEVTVLHGIAHLFAKKKLPFSASGVLVHRLDKDTTGCLLIAKTPEAHLALQKQFETRTVQKSYVAIAAGIPSPREATIDAPIGRNLTQRTKMSVLRTSVSREAQTSYRTLATANGCSLLLCDLHTGRTHQIRVHLSSINHPILGDHTYNSSLSESLTEQFSIKSLCLHALQLTFQNLSGQTVSVNAPVPDSFRSALQVLKLHDRQLGL